MEKTKKAKQKNRKEKNLENKEKSSDTKQRWQNKQQIRLNVPYYIYNGFEHNQAISDRDKKLLQHAKVPKVYISNVKDPKTWFTLLECMSRNKTITSVTIIDVNLATSTMTPTHLIVQGPPSIRELIVKNNNKEGDTMSLSNFNDLFKALKGSKTMERIGLFGSSSPGNKIKPDLLSTSINIAPNIKSYSLDYDWYEPCMLQTLGSAKHVTELSLTNIHYNEDLSALNSIIPQLTKLELHFCLVHDLSHGLANAKQLTSLHIEVGSKYGHKLMASIVSLKNQLKELSIRVDLTQMATLGEFLTNNCTLTTLGLIDIELCDIVVSALRGGNTTVTHLKIFHSGRIQIDTHPEPLRKLLLTTQSLKSLQLIDSLHLYGLSYLSHAFEQNTSLTELCIQSKMDTTNRSQKDYHHLCRVVAGDEMRFIPFFKAIKNNKTLKILNFDFGGYQLLLQSLLEVIQNHQSLRQVGLYIQDVEGTQNEALKQKVLSTLQNNKNLEYLKVHVINVGDHAANDEADKCLTNNYTIRHAQINQIAIVMKMAAIRPNLFGPHLPLEVWCLIFSFIKLDYFTIDCTQLFMNIVAQLNMKH